MLICLLVAQHFLVEPMTLEAHIESFHRASMVYPVGRNRLLRCAALRGFGLLQLAL